MTLHGNINSLKLWPVVKPLIGKKQSNGQIQKKRRTVIRGNGMSLYHFYEERRGWNCCDRLHEHDGRICPSWLSYTVCANELASSHGQSSPFALLKITFTAFAQLIQAHKKWELHRHCPLLLLLLWGPLQARPTDQGPKNCLLFMPTLLRAITIHIHMKSQSSLEQLSDQKKPGPVHPIHPLPSTSLTEDPFGPRWAIINQNHLNSLSDNEGGRVMRLKFSISQAMVCSHWPISASALPSQKSRGGRGRDSAIGHTMRNPPALQRKRASWIAIVLH